MLKRIFIKNYTNSAEVWTQNKKTFEQKKLKEFKTNNEAMQFIKKLQTKNNFEYVEM